ncbi:hypothetical protein MHA_1744 [Mannheimia haemolytica PHL213]|nr:hypothetical protein MHA_1744 [Mannheimia haemolytica PHL213]
MVRDHGKRESTTRGDQIWATPVLDTDELLRLIRSMRKDNAVM